MTTPRSVHADCPTSSDATDGAPKQQICCYVRERIAWNGTGPRLQSRPRETLRPSQSTQVQHSTMAGQILR